MSIKHIHVLIILASIVLSCLFGVWTLSHSYALFGFVSFAVAVALLFYCIAFIKRSRTL